MASLYGVALGLGRTRSDRYGEGMDRDVLIRRAAVDHCRILAATWGDAVPASELTKGFEFQRQRILLVAWGRGIFKPEQLQDGPLTLVSSLGGNYEDEALAGDVMLYDYAPQSFAWANEGLKRLSQQGRSVILLKQVKPKPRPEYMIFAPVVVQGFDEVGRKFRLDLSASPAVGEPIGSAPATYARRYTETIARARLHQAYFRRDALTAYKSRCCICSLSERPLLDAAHIIADNTDGGVANVTNGMAMCPTHHRAFDRHLLLVAPDYKVHIQRDLLTDAKSDATARVLLEFDGKGINLPRDPRYRPNPEFLKAKWILACG